MLIEANDDRTGGRQMGSDEKRKLKLIEMTRIM